MRRAWLIAVVVAALAPTLLGQQAIPARDGAAQSPTSGTASIAGIVVDDEARPVPVRRALVTISGPGIVPNRSAITDDAGAFSVEHLPAGRFTLMVSRSAFVTSTYGAKRPGRSGTPVVVADGQRVAGLSVTLWRGAVVAGVVRGDDGAPAAEIPVRVIPAHPLGEPSILTLSNSGVKTNDAGEFRIFGLEPGTYLVIATPPTLSGAAITPMSEPDLDAAFAALRSQRNSVGSAPARAGGAGAPKPPATSPEKARTFLYAPIYYPGTVRANQATPVGLVAGQVADGLDFRLERAATAAISGVVTGSDGRPSPSAALLLKQLPPSGYVIDTPDIGTGFTAAADGTFRMPAVAPGDYTITARDRASSGRGGPPALWGQTTLSVSGEDVSGLSIRLTPGPSISGRVVFTGETLKPPADLSQWRLSVVAPQSLQQRAGPTFMTITVNLAVNLRADGTFEMPSMSPGSYVLQFSGPGISATGWSPRSLMVGDRDLLDRALDVAVGSPSMSGVLTMTDKHTEVSGTLVAAGGHSVPGVFVIMFAADKQSWGPGARRVRAMRPAADGRYAFADLPPGSYFMAAVADIDAYQTQDPAVLESLIPASIKVSIGEGEKKVQDLKIGG